MATMDHARAGRWASLILVMGGAGLLAYGLLLHAAAVSPMSSDANAVALDQPESALISDVAVGGLKRDPAGQLRKTYAGKAPKACPT
jgi:hypothetical protein